MTLEIAAAIVTLLSVLLTVRQSIWCWPVGIAGVGLYALLFWQEKLYADVGLQVVYVVLSFYGWYEWLYGGERGTELPATHAPRKQLVLTIAVAAVATVVLGTSLHRLTDAALPLVDSGLTCFSLVAQWLLTRKYIETWIVWVAVDVVYVAMLATKLLYFTAGLYAVFLILAILGYREWKRTLVTG